MVRCKINMPELPEVETVKEIIKPLIINKTIDSVDVFYDRVIQSDISEFKETIPNKTINDVTRYGKFLFIHLSENLLIIVHLRMEGKFRFIEGKDGRIKHTSVLFKFKDNTSLAFDDTRKFGLMYLTTEDELFNVKMIQKLGVEANKIKDSDKDILYKKLSANKKIKELLLDQSIMCGIGNIYAEEILYASKINPFTKGKDLTKEDFDNIFINAKIILDSAIVSGGSTIHSFHPSEGVDGRFQEKLKCYGNEGKKCPNCHSFFKKSFIGGRGTTYCPNCQIDKSLEKAIGITGPIGSGKSEILKHLKMKGYVTFSADEIVHKLYEDPKIKAKISKILNTDFDINDPKKKAISKKIMIDNASKKHEVEDYIYPILEEYLKNEVIKNDKIAIEVPLLFKAHYEYLFKTIFVVEIDKEKQISNLEKRNDTDKINSLKLNNDYHYENIEKVKILKNNGTLADLFQKIDTFLSI